ncbi:MAG: DUF21 domain-containing protein [Synechococcales cyanobacterium RU_4_20]|nr:DUF21 domain-containing protein [Synechococcales cyanobacterium RU_4_20]
MTLVETAERFAAVMALILLNAFFVAAEFSVLSVRQSRINQLVQEGDANAPDSATGCSRGMGRALLSAYPKSVLRSRAWPWVGLAKIPWEPACPSPWPVSRSRPLSSSS